MNDQVRRERIGLPDLRTEAAPGEDEAVEPEPADPSTPTDEAPPADQQADRPETGAAPQPGPAAVPAADLVPVAEDRLLHLRRGKWRSVPLPEGWVSGAPITLAFSANADLPALVSVPRTSDAGPAVVWRWRDGAWDREAIEGQSPAARTRAVTVGGQLVLAHRADDRPAIGATLVRAGRALPLGELPITDAAPGRWGVAGWGAQLALLYEKRDAVGTETALGAADDTAPLGIVIQTIDLRGNVAVEPAELRVAPPPPLLGRPDQVVMMAVLGTATILMFAFWRRDPRRNRLLIPDGYRIAPLMPRAMAGLIDLAPGLGLVALLEGITPLQMLGRWPVQPAAGSWDAMIPGLIVIGVTVGHTMLSELFTARTLGKRIMKLEVRSLTGRRPAAYQIIVRCALKSLDLAAQLLLLLPVIGPFRQRLGDLVARTVVLAPLPEPDEQEGADDAE